jgi:hypothetical protein
MRTKVLAFYYDGGHFQACITLYKLNSLFITGNQSSFHSASQELKY